MKTVEFFENLSQFDDIRLNLKNLCEFIAEDRIKSMTSEHKKVVDKVTGDVKFIPLNKDEDIYQLFNSKSKLKEIFNAKTG